MTIYVDEVRDYGAGRMGGKWCHCWTDADDAVLDAFAASIGLKSEWAQYRPGFYHYDLRPSKRDRALASGAQFMPLVDFVRDRLTERGVIPMSTDPKPAPTARVLTLTPPYGNLVALGLKRVETRNWSTTYRGPLVIHCSTSWQATEKQFAWDCVIKREIEQLTYSPLGCFDEQWKPKNFGKALGWCSLLDVRRAYLLRDHLSDQELAFGNYDESDEPRYGWLLGPFTPFTEPVDPPKGGFHLGLWKWYDPLPAPVPEAAPDALGGSLALGAWRTRPISPESP